MSADSPALSLQLTAYRVATDYLVALQRQSPDEDALLESLALVLAGAIRLMSEKDREAALARTDPGLREVVERVLDAATWPEQGPIVEVDEEPVSSSEPKKSS